MAAAHAARYILVVVAATVLELGQCLLTSPSAKVKAMVFQKDIDERQNRNATLAEAAAAAAAAATASVLATKTATKTTKASQVPQTFQQYYNQYTTGRGINKWSNALDAYERHFEGFRGQAVSIAEVGVQSGGSINMWHTLLGPNCHVYGIDINSATQSFQDAATTIIIGDQSDSAMWLNFFTAVTSAPLNILVDDGGHEPNQMLVTLTQSFEHLSKNGVIAIEDIHGPRYIDSFFKPAASYLAFMHTEGKLGSVHVYPFLLIVEREKGAEISFQGTSETVNSFEALWAAVPRHPLGHVILENAGWGPFLTSQGLANFFVHFGLLHESKWYDTPQGCMQTSASVCSVTVVPNQMQSMVTGIHIYANRLVVDVAGGPSTLLAVRRGTEWLDYR